MYVDKKNTDVSVISRDAILKLHDKCELISRLWFPSKGGPWPALLMRQPYGRAIASTVTYMHPTWWASHGYLVVIQDVRGQGDSTGEFTGFNQEASDTSATLPWVRSLPECNGKVGTYGFSYQGLTQLLGKEGIEPPNCLAPAMTGLKEQDHWSCEGGAFWWHLGLAWGIQLAALKAKRNQDSEAWTELHQSLQNESYLLLGPELLKKYDPQGMAMKWLEGSNSQTATWTEHKPLISWLRKPMLLIGGWWDPHLKGILDLYNQALKAGGQPELHIGPATHLGWWPEIQNHQLIFFNKHLQQGGSSKKTEGSLHLWNITKKKWQSSSTAKKSKSPEKISWALRSEGMACLDESDGSLCRKKKGKGLVTLVHDPWRPVPSIGGHLNPQAGLANRAFLDKRSDVATFTSKKSNQKIHLEGMPSLVLKVQSDQPSYDLCVALSIVEAKKQKVTQISTGVTRIKGNDALKLRFQEVVLQPLLAELEPGNQLRVSIAGSAWPAIGVNPGHERNPIGAPAPHCLVVTISLDLEESRFLFAPLITS